MGFREIAARVAKANDHIVARLDALRRLLRHHIRERVEADFRVIAFDGVGDVVEKIQERSRFGFLRLRDGLAIRAFTHAAAVILRDIEDRRRGFAALLASARACSM